MSLKHVLTVCALCSGCWTWDGAIGAVPAVTTESAILNAATSGFDAGGIVVDDGGVTVTAGGLCWNTIGNPTVADATTTDGGGLGPFTSHVTALVPATHYYFRAYATTSAGTGYGDQKTIITGSPVVVADYAWAERQPAGNVNANWLGAACSSDGSRLMVGGSYGRLYTSADFGLTWTERQPRGNTDQRWFRMSMSSDGTQLVAAAYGGRIYTSSDSGINWVERQPAGNLSWNWRCAAMSSNGAIIMVAASGGRLYISTDAGGTWLERQPAGDRNAAWGCGAMSSDGTKLLAGDYGRLYTSIDGGINWTERQPAGDVSANWYCAAASSDFTRLVVAAYNKRLYTSSDSGNSWTERQPKGNVDVPWASTTLSSDGFKLTAGDWNGALYTSTDSGSSWVVRRPAGTNGYWGCVAISSDGRRLVAGSQTQRLYTGTSVAAITTLSASLNAASDGFDAGGNILDDGGKPIVSRGVCWNTTGLPTIADSKTADGSGMGTYASHVSGLAEATHYYFRAYASNAADVIYGEQKTIITGSSTSLVSYGWVESMSGMSSGGATKSHLAMSSDGDIRIAAALGYLYTSANGGTTWTERQPCGEIGSGWWQSAISSDGTKMMSAKYFGRLYTSSNAGITWIERQPAGNQNLTWSCLAMSSDGTQLLAGYHSGWLYVSLDSGATWRRCDSAGSKAWSCGAMSSDGCTWIVGVGPFGEYGGAGRLYRSTDAGLTWSEYQPAGSIDLGWSCVAVSSDGTKLIAGNGERLYASDDSGRSWTERRPAGDTNQKWRCAAISSDGAKVMVGSNKLHTSFDSGLSWTEHTPDEKWWWSSVAISADGLNMAAGTTGSSIYRSTPPIAPLLSTESALLEGATDGFSAGGNITNEGGTNLLARGVCWNTSGNPTVNDSKTSDGTGAGPFTSSVTSLQEGTHYYFRAYATNGAGTGYGEQKTIITGSNVTVANYLWTERQPAGDADRPWSCLAMSNDGTKVIAGENGGRLYTSADSGTAWIERRPAGNLSLAWSCAAMSADGTKLIGGIRGGGLYVSYNSGANWAKRQPWGTYNSAWSCVAMSSDGAKMVAGLEQGSGTESGFYTSVDYGVNWTVLQPAPVSWSRLAMSSDGRMLLAVNAGRLYVSTDLGHTWNEQEPSTWPSEGWSCIAISSDGVGMLAGIGGGTTGPLYTSFNSGATWTLSQPAGPTVNKIWSGVAMSSDGTRMIAAAADGGLYTSSDSGKTWTERRPIGSVVRPWGLVTISADSTRVIAGPVFGGRLYTGRPWQVGDLNQDEAVNVNDMLVLISCASGPAQHFAEGCSQSDLSGDGAVDMLDFAILQRCFGDELHPQAPNCHE